MFHCFSAHDAFLDGCVHLPPSNSICQRVIFRRKAATSNLQRCKTAGFGCSSEGCVMLANRTHSQGQSAALRTCRMCKTFLSRRRGRKKNPDQRTISVFPEGVSRSYAVGAWGTAGDSGWKGVFQLDAFHGCFGKRWWKPGEVKLPVPPPGVLAVSEQTKKERQSESVRSTECLQSPPRHEPEWKNKPPSEFHHSAGPCERAARRHGLAALTPGLHPCGKQRQIKGSVDLSDEKLQSRTSTNIYVSNTAKIHVQIFGGFLVCLFFKCP